MYSFVKQRFITFHRSSLLQSDDSCKQHAFDITVITSLLLFFSLETELAGELFLSLATMRVGIKTQEVSECLHMCVWYVCVLIEELIYFDICCC
jgi:hypothetical protein